MVAPELVRGTSHGVTLLGDRSRPGGVTLAFTERAGGVSTNGHASLNLGDMCGDDPSAVRENRRRAVAAIGAGDSLDRLISLRQVHGDRVVVAGDAADLERAREEGREGADAIVCAVSGVPALICTADCAGVALVAEGAFALVHAGWRGTLARVCAKALGILVGVASCAVGDVRAYIGPHIGPRDYEVSADLAQRFAKEFGAHVIEGERNVNLGAAIRSTLEREGVDPRMIAVCNDSTASNNDRFFSYRAQKGDCGRHGLLACIGSQHAGQGIEWREA